MTWSLRASSCKHTCLSNEMCMNRILPILAVQDNVMPRVRAAPLEMLRCLSEQRPRPLSIQQRYQQWWTDEPTMNQQRACHWFSVMTHIQPTANAFWKSLDYSRSIQLWLPCIIMKQHQTIRIITISGHLVDHDSTMKSTIHRWYILASAISWRIVI